MIAFRGSAGASTRFTPGLSQTYIRDLNQLDAELLSGVENATPLGFSPDGEWLLVSEFVRLSTSTLKRVPLAGGAAISVGEGGNSATWGPDGTLIVGGEQGLWSISISGQNRTQLTTVAEGEILGAPHATRPPQWPRRPVLDLTRFRCTGGGI